LKRRWLVQDRIEDRCRTGTLVLETLELLVEGKHVGMLGPAGVQGTETRLVIGELAHVVEIVPVGRLVPPAKAAGAQRLPGRHLFALGRLALGADEGHLPGRRIGPML
jgi:hypothetical protein